MASPWIMYCHEQCDPKPRIPSAISSIRRHPNLVSRQLKQKFLCHLHRSLSIRHLDPVSLPWLVNGTREKGNFFIYHFTSSQLVNKRVSSTDFWRQECHLR